MLFSQYVFKQSPAKYSDKILVMDDDQLRKKENIDEQFAMNGFEIIDYIDDLSFRIEYESELKTEDKRMVVFTESNKYVPYDLLKRLKAYEISLQKLFPEVDATVLKSLDRNTMELFVNAYSSNFVKKFGKAKTISFIQEQALSKENVHMYLELFEKYMREQLVNAKWPQDWFEIAELKATIDVLAVSNGINMQTADVNNVFTEYCMNEFGRLSSKLDRKSPILINHTMEYMKEHSSKYVLIVMDGMSEFDWNIISESFIDITYEKSSVMTMIPSTTSVSRQCLLGGKLPLQLENPWKLDKEKKEFFSCALELGFKENQIAYERGYEVQFAPAIKCGVIIITEVDDIVHAQKQGREGMAQDIKLMSKQQKLLALTKNILLNGFDVYITSDHGNTSCLGMGQIRKTGVEVETKSRRFLVLKDFADKQNIKEKYGLLEYPKYYLPKEYDYLICDNENSFDVNGANVISHGGITLDEVIVPFIKIKAVENNG